MAEVKASQVFIIHLGKERVFAEECKTNGIVKIDFHTVPHKDCDNGDWDKVRHHLIATEQKHPSTAGRYLAELKRFYSSDDNAVWIAILDEEVWWCKAHKKVISESGGFRHREVRGKWRNTDNHGNTISLYDLSETSQKVTRYRHTVRLCPDETALEILSLING